MKQDNINTFMACVAASILGSRLNLNLTGDPNKVSVTENVIRTSNRLFKALNHSHTSMDIIRKRLAEKQVASKKFHQHFGFAWPL